MPAHGTRRLPTLLAAAWAAAVVYGTLLPWHGWRSIGIPMLAFMSEPWPRYWTVFDVGANVLLYVPLGALTCVALWRTRPGVGMVVLAIVACSSLSFLLESLQTLLPGRVPSRLDWLANSAGGLLGAGAAALAARMLRRRVARASAMTVRGVRWLHPHGAAIAALVVGWLIAQMAPQRMLFETGAALDALVSVIRDEPAPISGTPAGLGDQAAKTLRALQTPGQYAAIVEALSIAVSLAAVGLLVVDALAWARLRSFAIGAVLLVGVVLHTMSARWLYGGGDAGLWLSASAQGGLILGLALLGLLMHAKRRSRLATILVLLVVGLLLTNAWPGTAYRDATLMAPHGALRNVHGLLQAIAMAWPFAALALLFSELRREVRERSRRTAPYNRPDSERQ